jgi:hypothetical protein
MADKVEDLTVNFSDEEGTLLCKELDKVVLTKGTWSTIMFMHQDFDKAKGVFKAPKFSIRRYQKRNGEYRQQSKFVVSSPAQAKQVAEILTKWADANAASAEAGGDDED